MNTLCLESAFGKLTIVQEYIYRFGDKDNVRQYAQEIEFNQEYRPSSIHGLLLDDEPLIVFSAAGGASAVHARSALLLGSRLHLAVGDRVACFALDTRALVWSTVVDFATCFGIHYEETRQVIITHGELTVARLSEEGALVWQSGGADIFTEGFWLEDDCIVAIDFERSEYRFNYDTGASRRERHRRSDT